MAAVAGRPEPIPRRSIDELRVKAPNLLKLMVFLVSRSDHRNNKERRETPPRHLYGSQRLTKERNREMTGIQTFLSLVLFSSRVSKKVCVCVCVCVRVCMHMR